MPLTPELVAETSGIAECLDRLAARKREARPLSTYRLQFHSRFSFREAARIVPYLHALGVSHVYSSPILQARAGSTHGYDITDHNSLNPEIGSEQDFRSFVSELRRHGMGQILDFVPNHMGVGQAINPWWQDVLENGRASEYSEFFDIDWRPLKTELRDKLLLPILGNPYGAELEQGRIQLRYDRGRFTGRYYDQPLPLDPQTVPLIFEPLMADANARDTSSADGGRGGSRQHELSEFRGLLAELRDLPPHTTTDPEQLRHRRRAIPALREKLARQVEGSPAVGHLVERALALCNGVPGDSRSFDRLHRLLEAQVYRLAHWRVSGEEINYRRFFDINDLVGLRMENPQVFAVTHKLLRRLLAEGSVSGLRIDHCDGLLNPRQYLTRLQMLYVASQSKGPDALPPLAENGVELEVQRVFGEHDWMSRQAPLYTVVEKILEPEEALPQEWPVDGTSGYDFVNLVNGIFIEQCHAAAFTRLYHRFLGQTLDVDTLIYESKKLIMQTALAGELDVLTHLLDELSADDRHARDFTRNALRAAIREIIACFPVYRTYIDERGEVTERDRAHINHAVVRAKRRNPGTAAPIFDFVRNTLLLQNGDAGREEELHRRKRYFTLKFQQLTGPVMAKGLEDTVCYVYNRFISVNEVGGNPQNFGLPVDEFHRANMQRAEQWPYSMLATSTHDTKRSEDVRARLDVISEMPKLWGGQVLRWRRMNRSRKRVLSDGRAVPDLNEEYLLYQTLVGVWPLAMASEAERRDFVQRIQQYMIKAVHEAKVNLSWINPNEEYVAALSQFVERILRAAARRPPSAPGGRPPSAPRPNPFLEEMEKLMPPIMFFGALNSLAQRLLMIASPGNPDVYQGSELWDFSLVDPDNRRPVDFALRARLLEQLETASRRQDPHPSEPRTFGAGLLVTPDRAGLCRELLAGYSDGRIKLYVTHRALCLRRQHPDLFQLSRYIPLYGAVEKQRHLCAFAREHRRRMLVAAVPRLAYTLMQGRLAPPLGDAWGLAELALPPHAPEFFENVMTGEWVKMTASRSLLCREIFAHFPVALLLGR